MHGTTAASARLAAEVAEQVRPFLDRITVVVAPAFPSLSGVRAALVGTGIEVGAQDMFWADQGAFTGAVSPPMVAELATYVILGHSERRQVFGETDEDVHRKLHAALGHGLQPIVCVGESAEDRELGTTDEVVRRQVAVATDGLRASEVADLVMAYEPVWAIGTGRACDADEAARVITVIREELARLHGTDPARASRVLYGGSVNPDNVAAYLARPGINGALVGGASLVASTFGQLAKAGAHARPRDP
jgi:triosephosphate isomerase